MLQILQSVSNEILLEVQIISIYNKKSLLSKKH